MNAAISQRNDTIARLPIELSLLVFANLNPLDTWTLRSVSKQWNALLTTRDFQQDAVWRWSTHRPSDRVAPTQSRTLEHDVRHIQAFQTGRPFSCKKWFESGSITHLHLQGKHVMYKLLGHGRNEDDCIVVTDLCSGATHHIRAEDREQISHVILTSSLVAFTTASGGNIYWKPLHDLDGSLRRARLPSSIALLRGDGDLLVLLLWRSPGAASYRNVKGFLVLDTPTSQLKSVTLPCEVNDTHLENHSWEMRVDAQKEFVDLFSVPNTGFQKGESPIQHVRVSLDGSTMRESAAPFEVGAADAPDPPPLLQNTGYEHVCMAKFHLESKMTCAMSYFFDADAGKWLADETMAQHPGLRAPFALWKGSVFYPVQRGNRLENASQGVFRQTADPGCRRFGRYVRLELR